MGKSQAIRDRAPHGTEAIKCVVGFVPEGNPDRKLHVVSNAEFLAQDVRVFDEVVGRNRSESAVGGRKAPCKSSKDHSKPRNEVDTSLKSPV